MGNELAKQDVPMQNGMVQLQSVSDAMIFAGEAFRSGLVPSGFKSPQAIFIAVQQGAELGLKPMQSLQGIAVINGRTSLYDKTARGLVMSSKQCTSLQDRFEGSGDDLVSITTASRAGMKGDFVGRFSVKDAKVAGLWGKAGPWTNYPKEMLQHKSSARCLAAGFADILIGLPIFEDIQELPPERKEPTNPKPMNDPLLELIPEVPKQAIPSAMEQSNVPIGSRLQNRDEIRQGSNGGNPASAPEPPEGLADDLDYQASRSDPDNTQESQSQTRDDSLGEKEPNAAGPSSVEGSIENIYPPKSEKAPWNLKIQGIRMAIWKKSHPREIAWFSGLDLKKPLPKTRFRVDYTTEVSGQYTNHTLVAIESIK